MTIKRHSDYYTLVMQTLRDEGPMHLKDLRDRIADKVGLPEEERRLANAKGTSIFHSRIHWSGAVLVLGGLLERPSRGQIAISETGRRVLAEHPEGITDELVKSQDAYKEMEERSKLNKAAKKLAQEGGEQAILSSDQTPMEQLEQAIAEIEDTVASDLVKKIQGLHPDGLEKLILKLLQAMGYGASEEMLHHVGGSGDEGIDGVIFQDQLGFHRIYLQAKRYKTGSNIGPDQMNSFIGAIERKGGIGGVFVTTSDFTEGARKAVSETPKHIALINGDDLGRALIRYEIGVRFPKVYREVELDEAYFEELVD
jgi:restriction system protein